MSSMNNNKRSNAKSKRTTGPFVLIIGRALKQARQKTGLSQTEVAGRMGTSQTEVHRMENGVVDFGVSKLMDFARALDGASIEIHVKPDYKSKGGFQTETQFVILNEANGEKHRTTTHALVRETDKEGTVEEQIVWLPSEDLL